MSQLRFTRAWRLSDSVRVAVDTIDAGMQRVLSASVGKEGDVEFEQAIGDIERGISMLIEGMENDAERNPSQVSTEERTRRIEGIGKLDDRDIK